MRTRRSAARPASPPGFSLVEMVVVVFLLAFAMLGILSVFDASARINKSELDVADAQGAVRYGIFTMTRAIRMAGAGGLPVTQAVLNHSDKDVPGFVPAWTMIDFNNVIPGVKVISSNGNIDVRPGTDMIEIRGVINSPLIGFDLQTGCEPCDPATGCSSCTGKANLTPLAQTSLGHVNDDASNRPQFSQVDAYTAGTSSALVIVAFNDDTHTQCSQTIAGRLYPLYPQPPYNVGMITAGTALAGSGHTFGQVDFDQSPVHEFNTELPGQGGANPVSMKNVRQAGILDDIVFFIDNTNPIHPALAQGIRKGGSFDVVTLADDVEDMQIAYGIDLDGNSAITRLAGDTTRSFDDSVSSTVDGDEWIPNVAGETARGAPDFRDASGCPALHAVMISLVARSHDPDPTYKAPSARGFLTMDSPTSSPSPRDNPGLLVTTFRRRIQTLKINLRNYAYEGS